MQGTAKRCSLLLFFLRNIPYSAVQYLQTGLVCDIIKHRIIVHSGEIRITIILPPRWRIKGIL